MSSRGTRWTEAEDAALRRFYGRKPTAIVAAHIGRTKAACHRRALLLGLTKPIGERKRFSYETQHNEFGCMNPKHSLKHWRPDQITYLELRYGRMDTRELARRLGRSRYAVLRKAVDLGIAWRENRETG